MALNFFPAVTAVQLSQPLPPSDSTFSAAHTALSASRQPLDMASPVPTLPINSYAYQPNPISTLLHSIQQQLSPSSSAPASHASSATPLSSASSSPSSSSSLSAAHASSSPSSSTSSAAPVRPTPLTSSHVIQQLLAGGAAGAVARTVVAPLDRVKMLMQTQHLLHKNTVAAAAAAGLPPPPPLVAPTAAASTFSSPASRMPAMRTLGLSLTLPSFRASPTDKYSTLVSSLLIIYREEGLRQLWKGNTLNVARVIPYSAIQFSSYDAYKHTILNDQPRRLTARERLEAGALAGMTATTVTHPMDVVRLRLSVDKTLKGTREALREVWLEGGMRALFKGYVPTMLSVSPFIALNFASFDLLKQRFPAAESPLALSPTLHTLALGAAAGLFAQSVCYPLDTIRRRQQIKGKHYNGTIDAILKIGRGEGVRGFYRGMVPNAVKVVPSNAIRFVVYEAIKRHFGLDGGASGGSM